MLKKGLFKYSLICGLLVGAAFSCIGNGQRESGEGIYEDLPAGDFSRKLQAMRAGDYLLIDVRTKEEFEALHLKEALLLDYYAPDFKEQLSALDREKSCFLYCRSGNRSGKAMLIMKELGFREVYNLAGGIITDTDELPIAE